MAQANLLIVADASQAEAEIAAFQSTWQASMRSLTSGVVDTAKRVTMATGIAFAGQAAVFGLAYAAINQYEFNLREAAVIGGFTEAQMWSLNSAINESAKAWGVDATEIANGVLLLAHGGLRGQEIINVLDTMTQSVLANGISWEAAARAYIVAQTVFKSEGLTAVEIFDKLQQAAQLSIIPVEDFATTFGYAAGMVRVTGGSIDELLAVMALLTNAGQNAGIAARGFNQMLTSWVANAGEIQTWADSLGLGVQVMKDGKVNLEELLAAFAATGKASTYTADDFAVLFNTMDRNAARAFGFLLLNASQYGAMLKQIQNSTGTLATVSGVMAGSLQSQWNQIVQAFTGALRTPEVIEAIAGAFTALKGAVEANAPAFREIVVTIIRDFAANLPTLLGLLQNLLQLARSLLPVMNVFAQTFVALAQGFLSLPAPLQSTIVMLALFSKILPLSQVLAMGKAVYALYEQFDLLRIAMSLDPIGAMAVKALALKTALVGAGLAAAGVGTAMMAMSAQTREQAAVWSVATGAAWGLAAAQFALMAANMGLATFGVGTVAAIGLTAGTIAAIGTYVAAAAAHGYERGTPFIPETGPAFLHKGERVLTAEENAFFSRFFTGWPTTAYRERGGEAKAGPTYTGGVHGGTQIFNFYDANREDVRRELARFGL